MYKIRNDKQEIILKTKYLKSSENFSQFCAFKFENRNEMGNFKEEHNLSKLTSLKTESPKDQTCIEGIDKIVKT